MTNRAANSPNSNFLVDRLSENTLFEKIKNSRESDLLTRVDFLTNQNALKSQEFILRDFSKFEKFLWFFQKMYGGNRPLGGFGQGWQGGNNRNNRNNRGGYGNPMYGNRGGMRPQGWGGMGYGNMGGNQGGGWGNAWGQPQNMGGYGRMPNQMQQNQGMNYANAVKVSFYL